MADTRNDLPVAGYYRISRERGGMIAPELYENEIRRYCDYKGLQLHEPMFSDIGISGRSESRHLRKGMDELIARRHEFSAVITPRLNRFGRSLKDLADIFETFDDDNIGLVFLDVDVDTRTSTGRLIRNILASLAVWESDRISEGWVGVLEDATSKGRVMGATATPYGFLYDRPTKNLLSDPETAPVVREVYQRFLRGETATAIARSLNERGLPFKRRQRLVSDAGAEEFQPLREGAKGYWGPDAVLRVIEHPAYVGRGRRKRDGQWVEFQGAWEPLVEDATWQAAKALRAQQLGDATPRHRGEHLLSDLLACGECGKPLHFIARKGAADLYKCRNMKEGGTFSDRCKAGGIDAQRAENEVLNAFFDATSLPQLEQALAHLRDVPKAKPAEQVIRDQLKEVDRVMAQTVSSLVRSSSPLMTEKLEREAEALGAKQQSLEAALLEVATEPARRERQLLDLEAFRRALQAVPGYEEFLQADYHDVTSDGKVADPKLREAFQRVRPWEGLPLDEKRRLLAQVVEKVEMVPGTKPKQLKITTKGWLSVTK